jgi:hypothetical protein
MKKAGPANGPAAFFSSYPKIKIAPAGKASGDEKAEHSRNM